MDNLKPDKNFTALLCIVFFALLSYFGTFHVPFQFDDVGYVVDNRAIRDFSTFISPWEILKGNLATFNEMPSALRVAFMTRLFGYFSLAINYKLHGLNISGYHVTNLLLHIFNSWFLYNIMSHAFRNSPLPRPNSEEKNSDGLALFATLIFLCHPIQTQAVTYITSRFVLLASFCSLLTLVFYIRARVEPAGPKRSALLAIAVISAAAGMITKEFTFTLPFVIALYEFTFFEGGLRERARSLAPFILTVPIIPLLVFLQQGSITSLESTMRKITAADISQISRIDYLLTQFRVIVLYLRLLFVPIGQSIDHDISVQHSLASPGVIGSFLLLFALLLLSAYCLYRSIRGSDEKWLRIIFFGILWFFIWLSVESSIIPLGELSAEYRLYLPSAGIIIVFATICAVVMRKLSLNCKIVYFSATLLVLILCLLTILRNRVWQSDISLWQDAVDKNPAKIRPHYCLGIAFSNKGSKIEAFREFKEVLRLDPEYKRANEYLADLLIEEGKIDNAIVHYQKALQLEPSNADLYYSLGLAFGLRGDIADGISHFTRAITIRPEFAEAHYNLGIALVRSGRTAEAIEHFTSALRINPAFADARKSLEAAQRLH